MEERSLIDYLSKLTDKRRGAGRRHSQETILLIVLMALMSGYYGYRAIGDFIERNREDLLIYLQPGKNRLPTFFTVRRVLMNIDFDEFSQQFYAWAKQYINLQPGEWLSIDGKAIAGTVKDESSSYQDFVNLVSIFASRQKMVLGNAKVINSKESEIPVVQQLIEALHIKDVVLTLDALHCQKKQ
ncbi:MAG: ISAs1 family transposase [Bacteroidota bacterium]